MKKFEQRGQGGFTLIELLVVIAILGILAGVVVFAVGNSTKNAKNAACKTEKAAATTAIAAADTANETVGNAETPGNYLDTSTGNPTYWTYAEVGTTGVYTTAQASGAPSGTATCSF